jgi:hypothetical protein
MHLLNVSYFVIVYLVLKFPSLEHGTRIYQKVILALPLHSNYVMAYVGLLRVFSSASSWIFDVCLTCIF